MSAATASPTPALVRSMRLEARGVLSVVLEAADGGPLPPWLPGAHIDLRVSDGISRQYSLCGTPGDTSHYRVAVLRETHGRGGSEYVHGTLRVGDTVEIGGVRNHFGLEEATGYLFVAGGIGITPLLPMIAEVAASGLPWRLVYFGGSRSTMAFLPELEQFDDRVTVVAKDEPSGLALDDVVASLGDGELLYVCGPARLSDAVRGEADRLGSADRVRLELFAAPEREEDDAVPAGAFTVRLLESDLELAIPADRSILDVVLEAGVDVLHDCAEGICGSCETKVVAGTPEHRDYVLTEREKAANDCMMICVSRSQCPILELAL